MNNTSVCILNIYSTLHIGTIKCLMMIFLNILIFVKAALIRIHCPKIIVEMIIECGDSSKISLV